MVSSFSDAAAPRAECDVFDLSPFSPVTQHVDANGDVTRNGDGGMSLYVHAINDSYIATTVDEPKEGTYDSSFSHSPKKVTFQLDDKTSHSPDGSSSSGDVASPPMTFDVAQNSFRFIDAAVDPTVTSPDYDGDVSCSANSDEVVEKTPEVWPHRAVTEQVSVESSASSNSFRRSFSERIDEDDDVDVVVGGFNTGDVNGVEDGVFCVSDDSTVLNEYHEDYIDMSGIQRHSDSVKVKSAALGHEVTKEGVGGGDGGVWDGTDFSLSASPAVSYPEFALLPLFTFTFMFLFVSDVMDIVCGITVVNSIRLLFVLLLRRFRVWCTVAASVRISV